MYINASYIANTSGVKAYIASQAPLPHTLNDFWKMIWDKEIPVVIMLTKLEEKHTTKATRYWPNEKNKPANYGTLQVSILDEKKNLKMQ
eukprot:TRINITY_DN2706_c0_g1_i1.p1 TRINITY_DN2706_c0_g1~~TRINITY_DN2706_c0_g1_i1.p1  ORF type:complete len:89 (-),score=12.04 TRINITY_DN2706_c0_g1_i1:368-634(-)